MKNSSFTIVIGLLAGLLFGSGMIISGMVDPNKVLGFLDITGDWDASLAFVMGGALLVFAPFYHLVIKKRVQAINGESLDSRNNPIIDRKLILGSTAFGLGWGLAGFCPGPVVTSLSGGNPTVWVFMISMLAGMWLAGRTNKTC
ncbi:YeeE/YedE family protein [Vibrio sp. 1CM24A]|uniref:YeeE/YedE family protein n=1 Tax=Vibrio sp. 1CM24A TaxID=2929165 RepID=UPI0020C04D9B|nr:YeeE/YedE family protein [Vibrio sp. 1CM24A]MCK8079495.1 YeeE/YedE family protein [Vibrio sp. 1CM24A]